MNLFELMGVGTAKKKVKSSRPVTNLSKLLSNIGWVKLGKGSFSRILTNPQKNYIIKIFFKDSCYIKFVKYCLQNQSNPHLPKFRGNLIQFPENDKIFAVRMEKLEKIKGYKLVDEIGYYTSGINTGDVSKIGENSNYEWLESNYPKLAQAILDPLYEQSELMTVKFGAPF